MSIITGEIDYGLEHFESQAAHQLVDALLDTIEAASAEGGAIFDAGYQPTTRAMHLAALVAASVILAHELGQEVARDAKDDEAEAPAA